MKTSIVKDGLLRRVTKTAETEEDAMALAQEMVAKSRSAQQWLNDIERNARKRLREFQLPDTWAPTKRGKGLVEYGDDKLSPEAASLKRVWVRTTMLRQVRAAGDIDTAIMLAAQLQLLLTNHNAAVANWARNRQSGKRRDEEKKAKKKQDRLEQMGQFVTDLLARNPTKKWPNSAIARRLEKDKTLNPKGPDYLSHHTLRTDYVPLLHKKKT